MIPLRLLDRPPQYQETTILKDGRLYAFDYAPGDCWYAVRDGEAWCAFDSGPDAMRRPLHIAPQHIAAGARPMLVILPGGPDLPCGDLHSLHMVASGGTTGWTITGELPRITVSPSINVVGRWHGWIRDGVIVPC